MPWTPRQEGAPPSGWSCLFTNLVHHSMLEQLHEATRGDWTGPGNRGCKSSLLHPCRPRHSSPSAGQFSARSKLRKLILTSSGFLVSLALVSCSNAASSPSHATQGALMESSLLRMHYVRTSFFYDVPGQAEQHQEPKISGSWDPSSGTATSILDLSGLKIPLVTAIQWTGSLVTGTSVQYRPSSRPQEASLLNP